MGRGSSNNGNGAKALASLRQPAASPDDAASEKLMMGAEDQKGQTHRFYRLPRGSAFRGPRLPEPAPQVYPLTVPSAKAEHWEPLWRELVVRGRQMEAHELQKELEEADLKLSLRDTRAEVVEFATVLDLPLVNQGKRYRVVGSDEAASCGESARNNAVSRRETVETMRAGLEDYLAGHEQLDPDEHAVQSGLLPRLVSLIENERLNADDLADRLNAEVKDDDETFTSSDWTAGGRGAPLSEDIARQAIRALRLAGLPVSSDSAGYHLYDRSDRANCEQAISTLEHEIAAYEERAEQQERAAAWWYPSTDEERERALQRARRMETREHSETYQRGQKAKEEAAEEAKRKSDAKKQSKAQDSKRMAKVRADDIEKQPGMEQVLQLYRDGRQIMVTDPHQRAAAAEFFAARRYAYEDKVPTKRDRKALKETYGIEPPWYPPLPRKARKKPKPGDNDDPFSGQPAKLPKPPKTLF